MEQNNSEKPQEIANNKMGTEDNAAENPQTQGNINPSEKAAADNSVNTEEKSSENKKSESPAAQDATHTAATAMSESAPMSGINGKKILKTLFKNVVLLSLSSVFALTIFFIYKISADSGNNIIAMIKTGELYENAVMIFLPQNSGLAEEYRRKAVERYIEEDKEKQDKLIKSITENVLKLSGYNQNMPANITTIEDVEKYLGIFQDSYKVNSEKDKLLAQKAQLINAEEKAHCKKDIERLENDLKIDDTNTFLQFQLGMIYDPYRMQECAGYKDVNKAKDIYLKAAKKGNSYAQTYLGYVFLKEENKQQAFRWLKKAAANGNRVAQFNLAMLYKKGKIEILPFYLKWKNEEQYRKEKAEYWFRRAAAQGYKDAYGGLGDLYTIDYLGYIRDGNLKFDPVEAEKWLIKAAQTGDTSSMAHLGQMYLDGVLGSVVQAEIGLSYLKTAADKGDESAELYLANKYLYGYPPFIKKDAEIAKQIFHKLEKSESFQKSAKRGLAGLYLSEKNYRESYKYRKQLIEKFEDYDELEFLFSTIYVHGIKDDKDFKKEILDFIISEIDKGHYPKDIQLKGLLLIELANLYRLGDEIVNKDYQEYKKYITEWSQSGDPRSFILLGEIYEEGLGVEKNFDEAEKYYKEAAKQNSADALFHLANLHYNKAFSIKGDSSGEFKTALKYLNKSLKIEEYNNEANSLVGLMYYNGYGVKQDYAKAISFFRKAKTKDLGGIMFSYNKEKENSYMKICANTEAKAQCLLGKAYPEIASARGFADYFVREHNESTINYLKEQIAKGNEKAKEFLNSELDYKKIENNALEYLKAAKENGDKNAKYLLDEVISQKDGGMSAYQKWLETSADNGDSDSMVILGDNYLTDTMLEKNEQNAIKWYRKAANKGNPDALYNLGVLYQEGKIDGKPNYEEALKLFAKSAKKGKAEAYMKLGIYYYIKALTNNLDMMKASDYLSEYYKKRFLGSKSPEDYYATGIFNYHSSVSKAIGIMDIENSARLGYAPALFSLGIINLGEKNYDKSLNFFKTAAEKGDSFSYIMIPDIYRNIFNLPHKAKQWAEKGLANENIPVSVKAALIGTLANVAAEQGEDYKSYEQALLNLNKEHWAQSALGALYFYLAEHTEGEVSEKNYSKALYWYKKSSNDNAYVLGYIYYNKKGLKWHQTIFNRNYKKAYKWYKQSAEETGNSKAQEALGKMYYDGIGVNKNYSKAIEWLRKAGHNNRKEAQYMLGEMYEKGQGAYKTWYESLAWYKKAAGEVYKSAAEELEYKTAQEKEEEYSHNAEFQAKACYKLGEIYEKGNEAVKKDLAEARSWYERAAAQGHKEAQTALERLK